MSNLTIAATFVIVLNVLMWFGQIAALDINPAGSQFYNPDGSLICEVGDCEAYTIDTDRTTDQLPTAEGSISPTTGNLFTDIFSSVKSWFGSVTGLNYLINILAAPYNKIGRAHV